MRPNPEKTANIVTFTKQVLNGKLHFLCSIKITNSISPLKHKMKNSTNPLIYPLWQISLICLVVIKKVIMSLGFDIATVRSM